MLISKTCKSKGILYNDIYSFAPEAEEGNIKKKFYCTTKDASAYAFSD
jgi:hypothetical protein